MTKAVVFTHLPVRGSDRRYTADDAEQLVDRVRPYLAAYLRCPNVGLVYAYVDIGVSLTLDQLEEEGGGEELRFPLDKLEFEQETRNCLMWAVERVRSELKDDRVDLSEAPSFQFVGLPHLLSLLRSLREINPDLIRQLAGHGHQLTYDSPKFVESVIRLVRDQGPGPPIFRLDEDVEAEPAAFDVLIAQARKARQGNVRCFFSGGYGRLDEQEDPINDFAVRVHWLNDCSKPPARQFLRDLGELGATQITTEEPMSAAMEKAMTGGVTRNRLQPQVISGAGLYMSRSLIRDLPPFMNFQELTTWVDDHLKRRLHEALGHVAPSTIERVPRALFRQNRHPTGVSEADINWAVNNYFDRLLRGCVLHGLIVSDGAQRGVLAEAIEPILVQKKAPPSDMKDRFQNSAVDAGMRTLRVWENAEYGTKLLSEWAKTRRSSIDAVVEPVIQDAAAYVQLVADWGKYVDAIERLTPVQAYWLFRGDA